MIFISVKAMESLDALPPPADEEAVPEEATQVEGGKPAVSAAALEKAQLSVASASNTPPPATDAPSNVEPAPAVSAHLAKIVSVPQLPLAPIISQQLAQTPTVTNIDTSQKTHSQSRSQSDSQDHEHDPGLYELSGLSAHSKPSKVFYFAFQFNSCFAI